jgi:hypothetical protein
MTMTSTTASIQPSAPQHSSPWWRYGHVWLLLGLLTFAICASLGLVYVALNTVHKSHPEVVYSDPRHPQDGSPPKVTQPNMLPAEEASHHAVTNGVGAPSLAKPAPKQGNGSAYAPADDD